MALFLSKDTNSRALLRLQLTGFLKMRACRWHERCLERERPPGTSSGSSNNRLSQPCIYMEGVCMTAYGPKRRFAATPRYVRTRGMSRLVVPVIASFDRSLMGKQTFCRGSASVRTCR